LNLTTPFISTSSVAFFNISNTKWQCLQTVSKSSIGESQGCALYFK
jgi:hypothetical protein